MILYRIYLNFMNYIASWTGGIIRWGQFQATKEALTTLVICSKFQKNCFELWFYIDFFMILYMQGLEQITQMLSITETYYHSEHLL